MKLTVPAIESGAYPGSTVPIERHVRSQFYSPFPRGLYCKLGDWPESRRGISFALHSERIFRKLFFRETRESDGVNFPREGMLLFYRTRNQYRIWRR